MYRGDISCTVTWWFYDEIELILHVYFYVVENRKGVFVTTYPSAFPDGNLVVQNQGFHLCPLWSCDVYTFVTNGRCRPVIKLEKEDLLLYWTTVTQVKFLVLHGRHLTHKHVEGVSIQFFDWGLHYYEGDRDRPLIQYTHLGSPTLIMGKFLSVCFERRRGREMVHFYVRHLSFP